MATAKGIDGVIEPSVPSEELEKALKKAKDAEQEQVRLVAITMKDNCNVQVPVARGFKFYHVEPLALSPEMPLAWAQKIIETKPSRSRVRPPVVWHLQPPARPKNYRPQGFEREGRYFETETVAPAKGTMVNGREIYHSVSQAQHFISRVLRTREGIHRFITEFDTRPAVAAWGNYVITQKEAEERQQLGVASGAATVV